MFPKMVSTLVSQTLISRTFLKFTATRLLCKNSSIDLKNSEENALNVEHLSTSDQQIVNVLERHQFTSSDIKSVLKHVEKRRDQIPNLNSKLINESILYWGRKLRTQFNVNESGITNDLRLVLANVEPDLLFVSQSEMDKRIDDVLQIGILTGNNDFLKVFKGAPRGFLLQEWSQIMKKFYYFQYVIMEWWLKGTKDKYPTPHPLINYPKIIECRYEHIKARYLFAVYTGLKSPTVMASLKQKSVNFNTLLLEDLESYLKRIAPYCSSEEYSVFEDIIQEMEDDEDNIIEELAQLGGVTPPNTIPLIENRVKTKFLSKSKRKRRL